MKQIDILILELLDLRLKKFKSIQKQNYTRAAIYRDKEKEISRKIYQLLPDPNETWNWNLFEEKLDRYCQKNFGVSYTVNDSYKQLRREIKIRNLGI